MKSSYLFLTAGVKKIKREFFNIVFPMKDTLIIYKWEFIVDFINKQILYREYKNEILNGKFLKANLLRIRLDNDFRITAFEKSRTIVNNFEDITIFATPYIARQMLKRDNLKIKRYLGKSIAILGPSLIPLDIKAYEEINSYDLIFIPNYNSKNPHYGNIRKKIVGLYTIKDIADNKSFGIEVIDDLHEVIVINHNPKKIKKSKIGHPNYRYTLLLREIFYYGIPNKIQILLMESIIGGSKKIKLFNTNFMLESSYLRNINEYKIDIIRTHYNHDLISNYKFVKLIYDVGLIEVDSITINFLSFTDDEYLTAIERVYGLNK
jgi:hypothetical protein